MIEIIVFAIIIFLIFGLVALLYYIFTFNEYVYQTINLEQYINPPPTWAIVDTEIINNINMVTVISTSKLVPAFPLLRQITTCPSANYSCLPSNAQYYDPDQLLIQQKKRRCLNTTCIGFDSNIYYQNEIETYWESYGLPQTQKQLVLISFRFPTNSLGNSICVTGSQYTQIINGLPCNLTLNENFIARQLFWQVSYGSNGQQSANGKYKVFIQRSSNSILGPSLDSTGLAIAGDIKLYESKKYYWLFISAINYLTSSNIIYLAPQRLIYIPQITDLSFLDEIEDTIQWLINNRPLMMVFNNINNTISTTPYTFQNVNISVQDNSEVATLEYSLIPNIIENPNLILV